MSDWTPMLVLAGIVWGLPAIGLCIETLLSTDLEWHE